MFNKVYKEASNLFLSELKEILCQREGEKKISELKKEFELLQKKHWFCLRDENFVCLELDENSLKIIQEILMKIGNSLPVFIKKSNRKQLFYIVRNIFRSARKYDSKNNIRLDLMESYYKSAVKLKHSKVARNDIFHALRFIDYGYTDEKLIDFMDYFGSQIKSENEKNNFAELKAKLNFLNTSKDVLNICIGEKVLHLKVANKPITDIKKMLVEKKVSALFFKSSKKTEALNLTESHSEYDFRSVDFEFLTKFISYSKLKDARLLTRANIPRLFKDKRIKLANTSQIITRINLVENLQSLDDKSRKIIFNAYKGRPYTLNPKIAIAILVRS